MPLTAYHLVQHFSVRTKLNFHIGASDCFNVNQWEAFSLCLCAIKWRNILVPWNADNPLLNLILIKLECCEPTYFD